MENTGPYLFVLTATGCGGCLERIGGTDREAHRLATRKGLKVLNLLVYQGLEGSSDFVKQHRPSADRVLCDPSADFSVRTLGGSDATCWILVDSKGRLAWRGPADPAALEVALANLE